jgi:hypothetical protein
LLKTLSLIFILFISFIFLSCSSSKHVKVKEPTAKKWTYFRILADADDDPIFVKLQDDLHIDPKMERYTIIVDIRAKDPAQQYVLFGDDSNPLRFSWSQLSEQVRNGLINWNGNSKENLE